jgi:hypothetical protein
MYRGRRKSPNGRPSLEALLGQREGRPFCARCQRFVRHKDAVWIGRGQSRCPVCAELLTRRSQPGGGAPGDAR